MVAQPANALGDRVVVSGDHAAFARGHRLARVEGEGRDIPEAAGEAPARPGAGGARGILDHGDALRQSGAQSRDFGAEAEEMHRHHHPRALRHRGERLLHVDVERHRVDIHEDRGRTAMEHRIGGRDPGEGRHDDFVAGAGADRQQRQMKPPVVHEVVATA